MSHSERNLILPGNPRYQPKELVPYFGYDNLYRGLAKVETANLEVLGELGVIPASDMSLLTPKLKQALLDITASEVDEEERLVTRHDIRAWVHIAQALLPEPLARWVHVPLTSYDALDTGRSVQYVAAWREAVRPALVEVIGELAELVEEYADAKQIGRTHGQHALPITVGFWLAAILYRLMWCLEETDRACDALVGKISGAVGASNAIVGLGLAERAGKVNYEDRVLKKLGLSASRYSTQILPPEPMAHFLYLITVTTSVFGQLGRDCRHLMRTEIGELAEPFKAGNVGSSTMAHKRNPINFEALEGAWIRTKNEFGKVLDTMISEHQRDLVGSNAARDFPIILVNLQSQLNRLRQRDGDGPTWIRRVRFLPEALERNFDQSAHVVIAEPLYIAIQMAGYEGDAHRLVSDVLTPRSLQSGRPLIEELREVAREDSKLSAVVENIPEGIAKLLAHPNSYTGNAREKALEISQIAKGIS